MNIDASTIDPTILEVAYELLKGPLHGPGLVSAFVNLIDSRTDKHEILELVRLYEEYHLQCNGSWDRLRKQVPNDARKFDTIHIDEMKKCLLFSFKNPKKRLSEMELQSAIAHTYGYYADQLTEDCGFHESIGLVDKEDFQKLWRLYYLHEQLVLVLLGQLKVLKKKNAFWLVPTHNSWKSLKASWYRSIAHRGSEASLTIDFLNTSDKLKCAAPSCREIDNLLEQALDRELSIHPKYIDDKAYYGRIPHIKEILRFFIYLEYQDICGGVVTANDTALAAYGIDDKTLSLLDMYGKRIIERGIRNSLNRGYILRDDGSFAPTNVRLGIIFRAYVSEMIRDELLKDPKFGEQQGRWFESGYVAPYIRENACIDYDIYPGVNLRSHDQQKSFDADLILRDKRRNTYIFVQIKFSWAMNDTYWGESIRRLFGKDSIKKAVTEQLLTLRENISHGRVQSKLESIGVTGANKDNSYFIVVHNNPTLNFFSYNCVAMYDWNGFRNLIQRGISNLRDTKRGDSWFSYSRSLPIEDPNLIIELNMQSQTDHGKYLRRAWDIHKNLYANITFPTFNLIAKVT